MEDSYHTFVDFSDEDDIQQQELASGISSSSTIITSSSLNSISFEDKVNKLRNNIIGLYKKIKTPYGSIPILYNDWTASGKSLKNIELYLLNTVLPYYANTHTIASRTGHQSTCFRHESRQIISEILNCKINGKASVDLILFINNGTTNAINKLINALGLNTSYLLQFLSKNEEKSNDEDKKVGSNDEENKKKFLYRPIVFTSSYEHHSNLLPWRESGSLVVTIKYNHITGVDLQDLYEKLEEYSEYKIKIGAFSAASNITGILTDIESCSALLHSYGGLVFFDYAAAAPYVEINMNPNQISTRSYNNLKKIKRFETTDINDLNSLIYKDALYFSGHKFLGGPNCSSILAVKKWILPQKNEIPSDNLGGGTVFYVTNNYHRYLNNFEEREEGGTPNIISDIKMGLVMNLKRNMNINQIEKQEFEINQYVTKRLQEDSRIVLLGKDLIYENKGEENEKILNSFLPVFSFLIRCNDSFLHFHFVSVLLNDLFGIQTRGGCMCAGPFAQQLLGLTENLNDQFEQALLNKHEVLRPGFTRLTIPYWNSKAEIDYIINAIKFVADHGYKFLSNYRYNYKSGEWAHSTRLTRFPEREWLSNFSLFNYESDLTDFSLSQNDNLKNEWNSLSDTEVLKNVMENAYKELEKLDKTLFKNTPSEITSRSHFESSLGDFNHLRWFIVPEEVKAKGFSPLLIPLTVPIRPNCMIDFDSNAFFASSGTNNTNISNYAKKQSQKLVKSNGNEGRLPRFLELFSNDKERDTILEVLQANVSTALVQQSVAKSKDKSTSLQINQDYKKQNKSTKNEENSNLNSEALPVENNAMDLTCSTGSCSITRPNPLDSLPIPPPQPQLINGKVLSGPGITYWSQPSVKPTGKFFQPPKKILKLVGQAIKDWNMIEDGDRLLLGLSGGKDSLALLHTLVALQKRAPIKFEIACATVDPQTDSFNPSSLIPYLQSLNITYHYLSEPIVELAKQKLQGDSLCAFCSRFKRGLLYSCCRNFKYNKLVLAQHLDDLVESFMMSALHNGQIRTMKANYKIEAGDVRVIRPFIYVREQQTRDFSQNSKFPIINENCPACFEQPKERDRVKKLMAQEESMVPSLFFNLKKALIPFMHEDVYITMKDIVKRIENNNNNNKGSNRKLNNSNNDNKESKEETETPLKKIKLDNNEIVEDKEENILEKTLKSLQDEKCSGDFCAPCFELA